MRRIAWTIEARQEVRNYLSWLRVRNRSAALEAELDILNLVASAAKRPNLGRRAGFDHVRVRSLTKWHKRISYFVSDDEIKVLSRKDARQNV